MTLYVKLRESGEVKEVDFYKFGHLIGILGVNNRTIKAYHLGKTCDLCDEQGRLLVPQDDDRIIRSFLEWFDSPEKLIDHEELINQYKREQR